MAQIEDGKVEDWVMNDLLDRINRHLRHAPYSDIGEALSQSRVLLRECAVEISNHNSTINNAGQILYNANQMIKQLREILDGYKAASGLLIEECNHLRTERDELHTAIKLHLANHEHGCVYLDKALARLEE